MDRAGWLVVAVTLVGTVTQVRNLPAQAPADTLVIDRAIGPVDLDGRSNEPAWRGVTPLRLIQFTPTEGNPASDSAEIRLIYDDRYLYASARMFTPDPRTIRPGLYARDQLGGEDHFMLILDTAGDERTGLVFAINPAGGLTDYAIGDDGQSLDANWNGFWDGFTTIDEDGWHAELRVPLSTLRFTGTGEGVVMGLILHRFTASRNEFATHPRLSNRYAGALFRPSIARKIELNGIRARSPAYLTPYVLGGMSSAATFAPATGWSRATDDARELGADLKLGLTGNLTLDLTANTDFAQVEADNQQVNLSRFSLFFPEKRQFFLERGDIFQIGTADFGPSRLFHSRRIGLAPDGTPLRIYGGARVAGRIGSLDIGALSMQTATPDGAGSENDAVVRVRRAILGSGSYVGAMVTSRLPSAGGHNVMYATDFLVRPFGNDYLTAVWAQSFDDARPGAGTDAGLARINWARRSQRGLVYNLSLTWQGAAFEPGLGFQQRRDVTTAFANVRYGWFPGNRTIIQNVTPSLILAASRANATGLDQSRNANLYLNFAFKSGVSGFVVGTRNFERLDRSIGFGTASVAPGNYQFDQIGGFLSSSGRSRFRAGLSATVGDFYDGTITNIALRPSWNASAHFQGGVDLIYSRVRFAGRNESLAADQVQVRAAWSRDSRFSVATFLQYNRAADAVAANVRARYRFAEGRDLWVVYNDLLDTDRAQLQPLPRGPFSLNRTVAVKYSHTFTR